MPNPLDSVWDSAPQSTATPEQPATTNPLDDLWKPAQTSKSAPATSTPANPLDQVWQGSSEVKPVAAEKSNPLDTVWKDASANQVKPITPPPQQPADSTWDQIKRFATHPLVSLEAGFPDIAAVVVGSQALANSIDPNAHPTLSKAAKAYAGIEAAGGKAVEDATSPLNLGLLFLSGGLGAANDVAASTAAKLGLSKQAIATATEYGPKIARLINLGYSTAGIIQAYNSVPEIRKAFDAGDTEQAAKLMAQSAGNVAMSAVAGLHSLGNVTPAEGKAAPEPLSKAPVARIVDTDAAARESLDNATVETEAKTAEGKAEPTARVVDHDYIPTVSKDQILSDAVSRIQNNSQVLRGMLDPAKINSPADIQTALDQAADHIQRNIDPRVGTRISFDTQKALAQDVGLPVEELLSRQSGENFSNSKTLASRMLEKQSSDDIVSLSKLAAAGDADAMNQLGTAVARHQEILDQVAGIRSESGRTLGSYRIANEDLPEAKFTSALTQLEPDAQVEAAKLFSKINPDAPNYRQKVNSLVQEIAPSTTADKLWEVYRSFLLSGPQTVIKKTASDATNIVLSGMKAGLTGSLESLKSATGVSEKPEAFPSEAYWFSKGAAQALAHMPDILSGEFDLRDAPDFEHASTAAVKGPIGKLLRVPQTTLSKITNVAYLANYYGTLNQLAARQAISEGLEGEALAARQDYLSQRPSADMVKQADEAGKYGTFQKELGGFGQAAQDLIKKSAITKALFPFFKTPVNIVKTGFDYSPVGLATSTYRGDLSGQSAGLIGSIIAGGVAYLAMQNFITGSGPINFKQREVKEQSGWQANSIHVGDKYYQYSRLEPLGFFASAMADYIHGVVKGDEEPVINNRALTLVSHATREVQNLPFLMQLGSIVDSLTHLGQGQTAERTVDNLLASAVVPAAVKDAAFTTDRTVRSPQRVGLRTDPLRGLTQTIQERIPGLTKSVPPEIGITGEPVERPVSSLGTANPFPITSEKNNPVISELSRLGVTVENPPMKLPAKYHIAPPTQDEAKQLQQIETKAFYDYVKSVVETPAWKQASDEEKKRDLSKYRKLITNGRAARLIELRQAGQQ